MSIATFGIFCFLWLAAAYSLCIYLIKTVRDDTFNLRVTIACFSVLIPVGILLLVVSFVSVVT